MRHDDSLLACDSDAATGQRQVSMPHLFMPPYPRQTTPAAQQQSELDVTFLWAGTATLLVRISRVPAGD